ncbi:retroviral-like aspartic protease family protein [Sphingomonas sp. Leaf21]|uniref:retroviral-like aspartic protease family protein n=1 Tax=Sphingomonas sp. Leaf21 TaxID=2876550 RepID=UPI001E5038F4|nr:retroviral-like aspartic protease family protein [Sphingomonas sp. Leaf21]
MVACLHVWLAGALSFSIAQTPQRVPQPPTAPPPPAARITPGEAQIDDGLEITGESVAGEQIDTRMAIGVMIDGHGPYRFVVDSGADRSVIGERLARALALPPGLPVMLHGMAGASRRETALIGRLGIGSVVVPDIAAPVLPEASLGGRGLIGIDALRGQRLMLDFDTDAITVEDTRRPVVGQADDIVVTARRRGGQLILTQARAGGVGIRAVVDTGSQLTIGNLALRDALFRRLRTPPDTTAIPVVSVTGETLIVPMAIVPEMRIGSITMRNVPVGFADLPPFALFGLRDQPAMMLGTDLMGSFRRVSLDFGAKKVRFQLRRCQTVQSTDAGWRSIRMNGETAGACPPIRDKR